jgi:hypothetical protein
MLLLVVAVAVLSRMLKFLLEVDDYYDDHLCHGFCHCFSGGDDDDDDDDDGDDDEDCGGCQGFQ